MCCPNTRGHPCMCVCMMHVHVSASTGVCVHIWRPRKVSVLFHLCLIHLRKGLSLELELGWQRAILPSPNSAFYLGAGIWTQAQACPGSTLSCGAISPAWKVLIIWDSWFYRPWFGNVTATESQSHGRKGLKYLSRMLKPLPGLQQRVKVTTWGFPYLWLTLPCLFTFNLVRNPSCLPFISKSTAHGAPWASSSYHLYSYNSMWSGHSVSLGQIQSGFTYIKSHPYLKKE